MVKYVYKRMAAGTAALLVLTLTLCSCGPRLNGEEKPVPQDSVTASSRLPESGDEPGEPEDEPESFVQGLARQRAEELSYPGMSAEEAVRTAYRWLVERVYFTDPVGLDVWRYLSEETGAIPYIENRALSPLLFEIGSCEDFAAAMVLLLRARGLQAEYVAGYTISVDREYIDHAWAVVELEGRWYHLDPQLEQNVTKNNLLTYRYYLKSDEQMLADHLWGETLISYWSHMPEGEKAAIRELYTPPECPADYHCPQPEQIPLPMRPNMTEVQGRIDQMIRESGKGELPPIYLNVEPPVLVEERHVTPPLLTQAAGPGTQRYGREQLDPERARLYDALLEACESYAEECKIDVPGLDSAGAQSAIDAFAEDWPEYFWAQFLLMDGGQRVRLSAGGLSAAEIAAMTAELERAADEVLAAAAGKPPREALRILHDHIADNLAYVKSAAGVHSGNAYGALVQEQAYCDGYAKGFQYLANRAGFETVYIRGFSLRGIAHAWNAVKLEGEWSYVDVTWDRPMGRNDRVYHDYFLITLEEIGREREWDATQYPALPASAPNHRDYYEDMGFSVGAQDRDTDYARAFADAFYPQLTALGSYPREYGEVFLEVKVHGDYPLWKERYIKHVFEILQLMEARAREERQPFAISADTSVRCDFNDTMQILTFYPLVRQHEEGTQ